MFSGWSVAILPPNRISETRSIEEIPKEALPPAPGLDFDSAEGFGFDVIIRS